jgi:glucosyl-3-phosphoglycerate synthase
VDPDAPWTVPSAAYSLDRVRAARGDASVAVVVPVRDEESTIGDVIDAVLAHEELVDELVVVNDRSSDASARVAERHGAKVVDAEPPGGKGRALRAGVEATSSSLLVFLDGDVANTTPDYVGRLIQPLLESDAIQLVKPIYERPYFDMPTGGGRVNELAARPILSLLFPGLDRIRQPLAGETALRRSALAGITLAAGYDIEIALLIDVARRFGVSSIAQVDLGVRRHRNRPLDELRPMATDVLRSALGRFGLGGLDGTD